MLVTTQLKQQTIKALKELYGVDIPEAQITLNQTKPEFEGEYTVVLFSFVKQLKKSPDALGQELGDWLVKNATDLVAGFNVIKGFLNLVIAPAVWADFLHRNFYNTFLGTQPANGKTVMVEYASPNTNKPLHLGHLRNIFLGWSMADIYKANGYNVVKSCIVNDRGIHICKSMIAWQLFANGATPESTNTKGDHFVGDYYVKCESEIRKGVGELITQIENGDYSAFSDKDTQKLQDLNKLSEILHEQSEKNKEKIIKITEEKVDILRANTPIMKGAQQMLVDWEAGKPEVIELWKMMNSWVYKGFDETYNKIGADFDKTYYESDTYLLGKKIVQQGLEKGVFYKKDDGSVWIDLTAEGLDEKLVLRKDGTSVYITQDIGLAEEKYDAYKIDESIYVIGDEQNYHMKVLQLICKKMGMPFADGIYHLSYGMVELPTGRMKSREGTVVDADDIVSEMEAVAKAKTEELGKVKDFSDHELANLYTTLGLGALKFYLLRVDPKKKMIFNPEESIDFHGFTGPFIQYTYARIQSIFRKAGKPAADELTEFKTDFLPLEKELIFTLEQFPEIIQQAAAEMNPSAISIYVFKLASLYNSFYTEHSIANAETEDKKQLRLTLSQITAQVIENGMRLLGISVPERM
jgi:arginyl-tRNA synthetase